MERLIPVIPPYPDLPVVQKREEFLRLLTQHQVIIVQADTGSGKSTQLPKFLLEAGLGQKGRIGITQPRRIAAMSITDRLREELKDETLVSTRIRFFEEGSADAPLKVMTDGILLQEFRKDRLLRQYGAILLDEAHERSLNIDILLGILRGVVEHRPEFRLVVASATLDAKLFQEFFPGSAILEAEGRMFPVSLEYRAPEERKGSKSRGDSGLLDDAEQAVLDLLHSYPDNLLCFLPTERDIQDLADDLRKQLDEKRYDILPLFGRLSPADQKRVFHSSSKIKVVLATNIAETSLTIPGIAYVVDTGQARVSRYNAQSRIQGLPVEDISQASARQRTGRAGRVKPGRCIRLYSEEEFRDRPEYTDPEIRRSNLANVVLQLRSLGLKLDEFPFLQPPPRSAFRGAYRQLHELGALVQPESDASVTRLGQEMAKLPMDVALSAVLLRARDLGVLQPALIVTAALSIQDPRITPMEGPDRDKARECHRKLGGNKSDFLTLVRLWNHVHKSWEKGDSLKKLRKFCEENWLNFLRLREWMDLYEQFGRILQVDFMERACPLENFHRDNLHIALLGGFLGGIARRDIENACYRIVGGREGHLFPGSDVYGKSPEWVFGAEVRETSRVFLARCAEIKPEWIIQVAEEFCTRRWHDPVWNAERGFVEAVEEVQFRGMVISRGRRVDFGKVDPVACAQIFWREAVSENNMARPFVFMENNFRVLEHLRGMEARLRRWGLAPSEAMIIEHYRNAAPEVTSLPSLKKYIEKNSEKRLTFTVQTWVSDEELKASPVTSLSAGRATNSLRDALQKAQTRVDPRAKTGLQDGGTLETFTIEGIRVTGELIFDRNHTRDGLRLELPLSLWARLTPARIARQIPQWRGWMLDALYEQLPGPSRKKLEPERENLEDSWIEALGENPEGAPLVILLDLFRTTPLAAELSVNIVPQKDTHLRLHLDVIDSACNRRIPFELSPESGAAQVFLQFRSQFYPERKQVPVLPLCHMAWNLPHALVFGFGAEHKNDGNLAIGYGLLDAEESKWWSAHWLAFPQEPWAGPFKDLLDDRLGVLEVLGARAVADWIPLERRVLLGCLLASETSATWDAKALEKRLERFSGLEGLQGRRMESFHDLGKQASNEPERVRLALVRNTFDSATLGIDAFVYSWNQLRDCSLRMRRSQKLDTRWKELTELQDTTNELAERLALASAFCAGAPNTPFADIRDFASFSEWLTNHTAAEEAHFKRWKTLRERLRPWLSGNQINQTRRNQIRESLTRIESGRTTLMEGFLEELELEALDLELRWNALRKPQTSEEEAEVVTLSDLQKLRAKFKG
jgi:HrpA-like RNA helicase